MREVNFKPDIVGISETKTNENPTYNYEIENYKFEHEDSNKCAGGVAIYVKNHIKHIVKK